MAFAAAKKLAAVLPELGALIELQGRTSKHLENKNIKVLATYPTIPRPQCEGALQKNQIAVSSINYRLRKVTVTETSTHVFDRW